MAIRKLIAVPVIAGAAAALTLGLPACASGAPSTPSSRAPSSAAPRPAATPTTSDGWYQAGMSWMAANMQAQGNPNMVGFTPEWYCTNVLTNYPPVTNGPIPADSTSQAAWVAGCADAYNQTRGLPLDGPPSAAGGQPALSPTSGTAAADEQQAQSDLSTVQGISLQSDLGTLNKDVQVTGNDAGALKTEVASALADSCGNGLGSATNQDQTALFGAADQGPGGDETTDATDANTLQNNITSARSQVAALQNDLATLKADGASAPSGAQAAIAAARNTISQAVSTGNADIGQENGLLSQAYQAVMSLTQNSGCAGLFNMLGSGSITQPASIPHVG